MELVEGGSYYQLLHAPHQFHSALGPISLGLQEQHVSRVCATRPVVVFLSGVACWFDQHNIIFPKYLLGT